MAEEEESESTAAKASGLAKDDERRIAEATVAVTNLDTEFCWSAALARREVEVLEL